MLYDPSNTNNVAELQVVAATSLLHRSIDNEIALAAHNMRLQNIVQGISEELARTRNTDMAGLQNSIAELNNQLNAITVERDEVLAQFGVVKQREGSLKEELRDLRAKVSTLEETNATLEKDNKSLAAQLKPSKSAKSKS